MRRIVYSHNIIQETITLTFKKSSLKVFTQLAPTLANMLFIISNRAVSLSKAYTVLGTSKNKHIKLLERN